MNRPLEKKTYKGSTSPTSHDMCLVRRRTCEADARDRVADEKELDSREAREGDDAQSHACSQVDGPRTGGAHSPVNAHDANGTHSANSAGCASGAARGSLSSNGTTHAQRELRTHAQGGESSGGARNALDVGGANESDTDAHDSLLVLVGFSAGQIQIFDPFVKGVSTVLNEEVFTLFPSLLALPYIHHEMQHTCRNFHIQTRPLCVRANNRGTKIRNKPV